VTIRQTACSFVAAVLHWRKDLLAVTILQAAWMLTAEAFL